MNTLKEKLKSEREKHNLTRKEVAIQIGVVPDTYRKYEQGVRQPDIDTLIKLAEFYKTSVDYIIGHYN